MADIGEVQVAAEREAQGAVVPIVKKNGDPYKAKDGSPSTISVVGSESEQYRKAQMTRQRRRLRSRRTNIEPEDLRADRIAIAAACVTEWHGWEENGKPMECTPDNARRLLGYEHILEQVEAGIERHADFFDSNSKG